jgi:PPK2 family polyphosphate:nucleotide phosphotransferase
LSARTSVRDLLRVDPDGGAILPGIDPAGTPGVKDREAADAERPGLSERLHGLQERLFVEGRRSVLVVLQAMDTGGKDGTIRHVMSGMNPAGCNVTSFKQPTTDELAHDYLWRIHRAVPAKGMVGVFNRSHYEDVLVVRVHELVDEKIWKERYRQINQFERHLTENNVTILKFFLHISKAEQARRIRSRIEDKSKNWKYAPSDIAERKRWDDYMEAYEDAINECSTKWAPWRIVPADNKWARDVFVARAMVEALESLKLRFPKSKLDLSKVVIR